MNIDWFHDAGYRAGAMIYDQNVCIDKMRWWIYNLRFVISVRVNAIIIVNAIEWRELLKYRHKKVDRRRKSIHFIHNRAHRKDDAADNVIEWSFLNHFQIQKKKLYTMNVLIMDYCWLLPVAGYPLLMPLNLLYHLYITFHHIQMMIK